MKIEVRKISKKSKIIILLLILLGIISFLGLTYLKNLKMKEILNSLGYKNISGIEVISKLSVENNLTKKRGTLYKVVFYNKANQKCIGFVHKDLAGKYYDDFDCK